MGIDRLKEVLTHELGHHLGAHLRSEEWTQFYQLRGIPKETPLRGASWDLSPDEDFAEVYMNVFTGINIRTKYGILLPSQYGIEQTCGSILDKLVNQYLGVQDSVDVLFDKIRTPTKYEKAQRAVAANPKLQACRKMVMANPSKYEMEFFLGQPYVYSIDEATRQFITNVVSRF